MSQHPELYRVYDVIDSRCRHFTRKGDESDGICCGHIYCDMYHEHYIKSKIDKANTGKFFVMFNEITSKGVRFISLWNRETKRHLTE